MARNKVVHLGDIEVNNYSRSKYIINKADFIGRKLIAFYY